jgi:hypothetical protein
MDLLRLRQFLKAGTLKVRLTTHARIEAMKDGLTEANLRYTLEQGEEIEDYPDRARALLLGWTGEQFPCHIVIEWERGDWQVVIVSAYIPDRRDWSRDWRRRQWRKAR